MILGIGVDILHLPRLRALLQRRGADRLARRILSPREQQDFGSHRHEAGAAERYLAVRWTAKEAAFKACYPARRLTWQQCTVLKADGKPTISLSGGSHGQAPRTHLSISHDGDYVVAYVVAEEAAAPASGPPA